MMYKQTTQIPNIVLDHYLPSLTIAELKILLIIIRQTFGWIDKRTERRKTKDRISQSQFVTKTGLCKRAISIGLQSLVNKGLIAVSDHSGKFLNTSLERKGISPLFYSFNPAHFITPTSAENVAEPAHKSALYKTNYTKLNKTKLRERFNELKSIGEVIDNMAIRKMFSQTFG